MQREKNTGYPVGCDVVQHVMDGTRDNTLRENGTRGEDGDVERKKHRELANERQNQSESENWQQQLQVY